MADNLRNDRNDGRCDDGRNIGKTLRCDSRTLRAECVEHRKSSGPLVYLCIQVGELLFSGLLISSLGAVMDVAMSVSSAMDEVVRQNAAITRRELFHAGNRRKLRRCPVRADHGTDRKSSSACSAEKQTRSMNQNPSCRLLYTDASNTGEFLQSEIPGVLLARQHGKENHWEDVTS